jgi:hypothetical protein
MSLGLGNPAFFGQCSARELCTRWGRANDRIDGMIEFIAGVMDWLERRHCAVCGQYIGDERECQNAVCVLRVRRAQGAL